MPNKALSFGDTRARGQHDNKPTVFQRPDRIVYPLDVVATVFNAARYRTRWKHYEDFVSVCDAAGGSVRLWTVEIAFGNREFAVTDPTNERHLQLRTNDEIWHKERSQNLVVNRILARHPNAELFAFIDADVSFVRHDWADETRHALQHYDVVQMWDQAYDLDHNSRIVHSHQSLAFCYQSGIKRPANADYYYSPKGHGKFINWHPGFCWAWRRSALQSVGGLIDFAVLGSADFHMAHALIGNAEATLTKQGAPRFATIPFAHRIRRWQTLAERHIKRNIGYVHGTVLHHWHGPKVARGYETRYKILQNCRFDPESDLTADVHGLYRLEHHGDQRSNQLRDGIRKYFHSRNEDAI